jgi:hypothetical protein
MVQVTDHYGTYRNTGIWRVEVRKAILALASPFSTSLAAAPFEVRTRSFGPLTVWPKSRNFGTDAVVMIPEDLFGDQTGVGRSDRVDVIAEIAKHPGMSADLGCHYDKPASLVQGSPTMREGFLCPAITLAKSGSAVSGRVTDAGVMSETELRSIKVTITVVGS